MTALLLPGISIRLIQQLVAESYKVPVESMASLERIREVAWPRQMAMFLAHEFTRHSLTAIGHRFGERDHSTVWYACHIVPERALFDRDTGEHLAFLRSSLEPMRPKVAEFEREQPEELACAA